MPVIPTINAPPVTPTKRKDVIIPPARSRSLHSLHTMRMLAEEPLPISRPDSGVFSAKLGKPTLSQQQQQQQPVPTTRLVPPETLPVSRPDSGIFSAKLGKPTLSQQHQPIPATHLTPPTPDAKAELISSSDTRPESWVSVASTASSGQYLDKDLFDAFPAVPQMTPSAPQALNATYARPRTASAHHSSLSQPIEHSDPFLSSNTSTVRPVSTTWY
jgi:hypothetical protein